MRAKYVPLLLGALCLLVVLTSSPAKAQENLQSGCQFQDPFVDPGTILGMHDLVSGGWAGVDMSFTGGVRSIFADGGDVYFAGWDNVGGGNGFILKGTGNCSGMAFAAWHANSPPAISGQVDPNMILVTPGTTGDVRPATYAHNHVTFLSTQKGLCGIPDSKAWSEPGTTILGDAWAYDPRDVISYCGTSQTASSVAIGTETVFKYPNYSGDARYNAFYYWVMLGNGRIPAEVPAQFSGSFTFEPGKTYYATAMGGGSYDKVIGYHCMGENCQGVDEGLGVCDAISTWSKFVYENSNSCISAIPDDKNHHGNYTVPEAGKEWSIAVTAPKGTPLTQDPTIRVGGADVAYTNNCDYPITFQFDLDGLNSVTVRSSTGRLAPRYMTVELVDMTGSITVPDNYLDSLSSTDPASIAPTTEALATQIDSQQPDDSGTTVKTINNPATGKPMWWYTYNPAPLKRMIELLKPWWDLAWSDKYRMYVIAVVVAVALVLIFGHSSDNEEDD